MLDARNVTLGRWHRVCVDWDGPGLQPFGDIDVPIYVSAATVATSAVLPTERSRIDLRCPYNRGKVLFNSNGSGIPVLAGEINVDDGTGTGNVITVPVLTDLQRGVQYLGVQPHVEEANHRSNVWYTRCHYCSSAECDQLETI